MLVTCQEGLTDRLRGHRRLERAAKPLLKLGRKTFTVKKGWEGLRFDQAERGRGSSLLRKSKNGTLRVKG